MMQRLLRGRLLLVVRSVVHKVAIQAVVVLVVPSARPHREPEPIACVVRVVVVQRQRRVSMCLSKSLCPLHS